MTRAFGLALFATCLLGVVASVAIDSAANKDVRQRETVTWDTPKVPANYVNARGQLLGALNSGYLFPKATTSGAATMTESSDLTGAESGDFPTILSITRVDGKNLAHIRHLDKTIATVIAGDEPVDGWVVTRISSDAVEAVRNGQSHEFVLFEPDA